MFGLRRAVAGRHFDVGEHVLFRIAAGKDFAGSYETFVDGCARKIPEDNAGRVDSGKRRPQAESIDANPSHSAGILGLRDCFYDSRRVEGVTFFGVASCFQKNLSCCANPQEMG